MRRRKFAVAGHSQTQLIEYIDFLQDAMIHPVTTRNGCYVTPSAPGWGLEFKPDFLHRHRFPDGDVWRNRDASRKGAAFEVSLDQHG